jgi:predicted dehydrogenase
MKLGILGFAHGHVGMYCTEWRAHPELGIDLVAGWDHDRARAESSCATHGLVARTDAAAVLDDVDAVVIAAETSLHADLVELAAARGKAVVLQKPAAVTLADAERIVRAVSDSGVDFTMAWQMRVDPQNLKIGELLAGGAFGRVFMVRRRHGLSTHRWPDFADTWHASPEYNRDIWADDAVHPVDFLYWLFGMPHSVTAELASLVNPKVPNDNGIAIYRYNNGMIAEVSCSFVCTAHENTTEIVAENGTIIQNHGDGVSSGAVRAPGGHGLKWYLASEGVWQTDDAADQWTQGERISNLARPIAEFLHKTRPPIASAQDGLNVLRMVLACYESSDAGRRVGVTRAAL